jgi:isopentenyl diphosphate isomerase/L-lactate dehydrogenase-like FMN-dependent dehydrogenase
MFNDNVEDALNVHDLRIMAQKRLPKWLFEFVDRGTEDEVALRNNRAAFERIKLKTQVLVDVSNRNQAITLFGKNHDMPIRIAPTGPAGMLYYRRAGLARARAQLPLRSRLARRRAWKVAKVVGGTLWFQPYMCGPVVHGLVERAKMQGSSACSDNRWAR